MSISDEVLAKLLLLCNGPIDIKKLEKESGISETILCEAYKKITELRGKPPEEIKIAFPNACIGFIEQLSLQKKITSNDLTDFKYEFISTSVISQYSWRK